jgi:hypothetical protein
MISKWTRIYTQAVVAIKEGCYRAPAGISLIRLCRKVWFTVIMEI